MRKQICAALAIAYLAGCAHESPVPVATNDKFAPQIVIDGPPRHADPILGISRKWYLKSFVDKKTGHVTHQLYVSIAYVGSWRFFDTATNDRGQSLPVRQVDPSVGNACDIQTCDAMGIELSASFLRATAASGFAIKLADDSGNSFVLDVSPQMVTEQLQASTQQSGLIDRRG